VTGLTLPKSSVFTVSALLACGAKWPLPESLHSKRRVVPGAIVSTGWNALFQPVVEVLAVDGVRCGSCAIGHRSRVDVVVVDRHVHRIDEVARVAAMRAEVDGCVALFVEHRRPGRVVCLDLGERSAIHRSARGHAAWSGATIASALAAIASTSLLQ